MKKLLLILFIIANIKGFSQISAVSGGSDQGSDDKVSFTVKFDKSLQTKDGYYLNGYVVQISDKQADKFHCKTIKISGKVTVVKGLDSQPKEYDDQGNEIFSQGRQGDTNFILSPKIKIVK
ncbi:MAG: hypothetical protein A2W91_13315 [Bacteroidetes bacterium GWF2_38_335]|nr:MAG: hypothetical protein A2W91_13315 [Bacteroidetes bacterium GWF2_38_335]OFY77234.1 MAG: hypothetical protein A2281_14980 [Bacteroidetes bacterium RIFOXYA12_FULL_38_20]HBS85765.1 hypothetical protein [Bacteroidales bacterium]